MAKRHTAIHAACALLFQLGLRHVLVKLVPMRDALQLRLIDRELALELHESCRFAHRVKNFSESEWFWFRRQRLILRLPSIVRPSSSERGAMLSPDIRG